MSDGLPGDETTPAGGASALTEMLEGADTAMKDNDIGSTEYWRDIKHARHGKRADNRENSASYLRERGIPFTEKNFGAHLIVEGRECFIDFWPGTGKWHCRSGKKGFGVRNLVEYITAPSNV